MDIERIFGKTLKFIYMKCPTCQSVELVMSERQGVEIDYCPSCRGIWLDRGELDKILDRANSQPNFNQSNSHHQEYSNKHYDSHPKHKNHHKKSWLSELFD